MIVLYVVLCFTVRAYQANPLYLEIHHRDPQTGEILGTTKMEMDIDVDDSFHPQMNTPEEEMNLPEEEVNPAALEYYYGCSMPLPPPIERSDMINDVENLQASNVIPSVTVIEKSESNYDVREPEPNSAVVNSVFDSTIGGANSIVLQLMSVGFRAFNGLF